MQKDYITVSLDDCRFYARHGVFAQERRAGNEFVVAIRVDYVWEHQKGDEPSDDLADTISYADLYEIVKQEMERPRQLLETVASTIADRIAEQFRTVKELRVRIRKITPPIEGINGSASVELKRLI